MKFEDLRLIQQISILGDMLLDENERDPNKPHYAVPGTSYKLSRKMEGTTEQYIIPIDLEPGKNKIIQFTGSLTTPEDHLTVTISMDDGSQDKELDKFALLSGVTIRGDLKESLENIAAMMVSFQEIGFVISDNAQIFTKLISLIDIAKAFPEELFNSIYVDPVGVQTISLLNDIIGEEMRKKEQTEKLIYEVRYRGSNIIYKPTAVYTILDETLGLTLVAHYGLIKPNRLVLSVGDYRTDIDDLSTTALGTVKFDSSKDAIQFLESLKEQAYEKVKGIDDEEIYTTLLDAYFDVVEASREEIIKQTLPF